MTATKRPSKQTGSKARNIYLIGFMATGKTAVGQALAKSLRGKYVSVDTLIEKRSRKKISSIFKVRGEDYFRKLETQALKAVSKKKGFVIACGGGIVLKPGNRRILKKTGSVIWLKALPSTINRRLKKLHQRPLLNIKNEKERMLVIRKMLKDRDGLYKATAGHAVNTDRSSIKEVVASILKVLKF